MKKATGAVYKRYDLGKLTEWEIIVIEHALNGLQDRWEKEGKKPIGDQHLEELIQKVKNCEAK